MIESIEVARDRDWWQAFGVQFGWSLYGWSYRDTASYWFGDPIETIQITKGLRATIEEALTEARAAERERCAAWVKANRHGHSINELAAAIRALQDS